VTVASQGNGTWLGGGVWLAAGATPKSEGRKAESTPRMEPEDKPPVLRRGPEASKTESKPDQPKPSETKAPETGPAQSKPSAPPENPVSASPAPTPPPSKASPEEEAGRPTLRRGKPEPAKSVENGPSSEAGLKANNPRGSSPSKPSSTKNEIRILPAISDAGGPEPRPYTYEMKPEEEQAFQKKMLALAKDEVLKRARQSAGNLDTVPPPKTKRAQPPQPEFTDTKLSVFDLFTSNEPVLVLSARARLPELSSKGAGSNSSNPDYYVTLVARADLYNELKIVLSAITDEQHLDVTPQMQLIDAIDADGDGGGELIFRKITDAGTAYGIYRVTADQLWPLFEGAPAKQ
jgi:hypothetical protein